MNNHKIKPALLIGASLLTTVLAGCGRPDPGMTMLKQSAGVQNATAQNDGRVTVTRIGVFADELAYSGLRGIYVLIDAKTGREYIGVSGIGISELGSH